MKMHIGDLKKLVYRSFKYHIMRPAPPTLPTKFEGPVLVVGSAPTSRLPPDFDDSFRVITINGSQASTRAWGLSKPDVTLLQFSLVEGVNLEAAEVRRVLSNDGTKHLLVLPWRKDERERLEAGLRSFAYGYETLTMVDRYERIALLDKVAGIKRFELDAESKCSNGMNAVLLALHNGATHVVITGINPNSNGHAYNSASQTRLHVRTDKMILAKLLEAGLPIFTADAHVSKEIGIPLWTGKKHVTSQA